MMKSAFENLYETYYCKVYRYLLKLVGYEENLAEELTQECFYQVFIALEKFRGASSLETWIYQIAKFTCYKYFRKNKKLIHISEAASYEKLSKDIESSPEEVLIEKEERKLLMQLIAQQREKYSLVLMAYYFDELPIKLISEQLHIKEGAVKTLLFRGRNKLKKQLEKQKIVKN